MSRQKIIKAGIVVSFPVLRALAGTVNAKAVGIYDLIALQSFAVRWLKTEMEAGGFICPACGNLWTTRERREVCSHAGGALSPVTTETIRYWITEAEGC